MIEFYSYIYKQFKLSIVLSLLMLTYIVTYVEGVVAYTNNIYISDSYLLEQQAKQAKAMYGLSNIEDFKVPENESILDIEDKYNTIKYNFSLVIDDIGINEALFAFPMTYNLEDYNYVNSKKLDENIIDKILQGKINKYLETGKIVIDFELMEVSNLKEGFMIGGHSSGLWFDDSHLKKVFNSLDQLNFNDKVKLKRDDWLEIEYKVIGREIKDLDEKVTLSNKFYIYTCYPVWSTDQRLIIELQEITE